ncbi:hypothetical protein [Corynebacterium ulcerans]|uniref:hypothetical protein n=1 Tax=Corynebacterium ulcerans TaxID=65058 RepID=UPI0018D9139A|nr:hypothetical protein [Corynebacterium ulcerans]MBH5302758.1 hypothetical protein [Corynebacterium ulcerans]
MLRPDECGETILVKGAVIGRDHRGRPTYAPDKKIQHCVVSPAGDQVVKGGGFAHGDISRLQIIAPAGTEVRDGDVVVIRGEKFIVMQRRSFDYSVGRRPVLRRHQPKVVFIVERGEVSENVS